MKHIKLTKNKIAIIDDIDFDLVSNYKWVYAGFGYAYAHPLGTKKRTPPITMHRLIMKAKKRDEVDHINRNKIDNRRKNLRLVTHSQNGCNRGKQKNNTSGYKGVGWHKKGRKWIANIKLHQKSIYLGLFKTKIEAVYAYNEAAKKYHGEFALLNKI